MDHGERPLAGQAVLLDPDDVDDLVDLLSHAATAIGALTDDAHTPCVCGRHTVIDLTWDLQLAAELLDTSTAETDIAT